jgi:hypothetical protein
VRPHRASDVELHGPEGIGARHVKKRHSEGFARQANDGQVS